MTALQPRTQENIAKNCGVHGEPVIAQHNYAHEAPDAIEKL